jgi:DNA-binding NarL/FixJ family response regulator
MRILIADDQPKIRFGLRVLLEQQHGWQVVGEVQGTEALLLRAQTLCPDVVLLGWELPGLARGDPLSSLRALCPTVCIIALSARPEAQQAARGAGVDAFVSKADPPDRLLATIADVAMAAPTSGQ